MTRLAPVAQRLSALRGAAVSLVTDFLEGKTLPALRSLVP